MVDGPSGRHFSNPLLFSLLLGVPYFTTRFFGGGLKTYIFFAIILALPILVAFWTIASTYSPRISDKVQLPNKPIEHYLSFKNPELATKYKGDVKIPMETFHELYFDSQVDMKGDALDILEDRHDWASFRFTISLFKFFLTGMMPEVIMHTRSQDEEQVRDHYDRGDDFYSWFLGPRMIYTSGIISDIHKAEPLEQLQDNKLRIVCEKIGLKKGDRMLDLGCGWGTLARFASTQYGAHVTGITLGRNQTAWGNSHLRNDGVPESQSRIVCVDYRDTPVPEGKYNKITCLEMAEHVGVRHFSTFLNQVYNMLTDDGTFFLQIAGLRKSWQYEDLVWGLFMNKYIFPGADASTPAGWVVDRLEGAGFELLSIDNIGVHYSATLYSWYRNWMANREHVIAKYGKRWFRIWEYFLASSVIVARQGGSTCFQMVLKKNLNTVHRVEHIPLQYGLDVPKPANGNKWLDDSLTAINAFKASATVKVNPELVHVESTD